MALTLTRRKGQQDAVLVGAEGAIDLQHAPALDDLFASLRREGRRHLVLDLTGVRYVSSSGFGTLAKHAQALEPLGGSVSLLGVPKKVNVVIEMLGLASVFACVCERSPRAA